MTNQNSKRHYALAIVVSLGAVASTVAVAGAAAPASLGGALAISRARLNDGNLGDLL